MTITNTAATEWGQGLADSILNFSTGGGPVAAYSNNAVFIDATNSGGLISPWGDANFQPGATVESSVGDTIIGAINPVGYQTGGIGSQLLGNVLVGSVGNDTITSKSMTLPDHIVTQGGADRITLAAGHTGADHVGFYAANGHVNAGASYAVGSVGTAVSETVLGGLQFVNPGWWGVAAGGSSADINAILGAKAGTSADNSVLTNFNPVLDLLDFSASAWGGANATAVLGLVTDTAGGLKNIGTVAGDTSATGAAVVVANVTPGGNITGSGADFLVLKNGNFANTSGVAEALSDGSYTIKHSALDLGQNADFLIAYAGTDGNAHIADLHLKGGVGTTSTTTDLAVQVADIVTLAGVPLNQLDANTGHIHLIN